MPLTQEWLCLTLPAGVAATPAGLDASAPWRPTLVPGTISGTAETDLHEADHWFRLETELPPGSWIEFQGLATLVEIWIDGDLVATSATMFIPLTVPTPDIGGHRIEICFRALQPALRRRQPGRRPRWRGRLATNEALRTVRTTLLGHMPSWSGSAAVIGPYRPIVLHTPVPGAPVVRAADLRARLRPDGTGLVTLCLTGIGLEHRPARVCVAGQAAPLAWDGEALAAELVIPDPPLWWPHTHGDPATCAVTAEIGGFAVDLGRVGFATMERRDPAAGFGLVVNGVQVFCRGAIWSGLDATGRPATPAALRTALQRARQAGFNMLRVAGMTLYETPDFFAVCDELGIMVWHDFMFARFDYPDDAAFLAAADAEARAFLDGVQAHPSLAVLCGGTEIAQAASMAGCPPESWSIPLFDDMLAGAAAKIRPDRPYVPHSPLPSPANDLGGGLPFAAAAPISHYFGVGGYLRPLQDLDSAGVRFAAECLAFANPPDPASCRALDGVPGASSAWRTGVVHEPNAGWDFEDVRDHYVADLFGVSPASLRRQNPWAWLDLGRAAVALVMQRAIATWRTDHRCAGALVLMFQDVVPGAGWGVVGHDGRPKSAWHALRSVCQPIQVLLRDLGQNGIVAHVINETAAPLRLRLALRGLTADGAPEALGAAVLDLAPRENRAVPAIQLMGRWRDLANAWQFGTPAFAVLGATLDDAETGARLSDATHFPGGPTLPRGRAGLTTSIRDDAGTWVVEVAATGFAQFVQLDDDDFVAEDSHFHLWPGESRIVPLCPAHAGATAPAGTVTALNASDAAHYGMAA